MDSDLSSFTSSVMKDGSSNTESNPGGKGDPVQFIHHQAHPGPAIPKDFNAKEEGTKAEREAKTKELNK